TAALLLAGDGGGDGVCGCGSHDVAGGVEGTGCGGAGGGDVDAGGGCGAVGTAGTRGGAAQTVSEMSRSVSPMPVLHEIPLASSLVEEPTSWLTMRAERLLPWVDGLWLGGVLLLAIRSLGGWFQLEQLRLRARGLVPEELERGFRRICRQVRVGRGGALRISAGG